MNKKKTNTEKRPSGNSPLPWITAVLLVLGLAVLGGLYWNSTGTVDEVRFEGTYYTSPEQLGSQVDIPTGVHPDSLDLIGIIRAIETEPYVKQAGISTGPGGTMTIRITERTPLALLVDGGSRAYVDADGVRLPHVLGKTPDVPILYGFRAESAADTLQSEAFSHTKAFLLELQRRPASDATISEVAWTRDEGIVALTNENGVKLIFGKGEFSDRLRNWEAFYREVVRKKGIEKLTTVDLRFKGQIVTRES